MQWIAIIVIGAAVGFVGGMFGKGGSAIATPLLAAVGVPPIVAVASPLPAAVPGTLVAYWRYRRAGMGDPEFVRWTVTFGVPAAIVGAYATRWIDGAVLVRVTELVVATIGVKVLVHPQDAEVVRDVHHPRVRLAIVATAVGLVGGLLANAGGFLLVPLYLAVLKLRIKTAVAGSLAVASILAVPGTIVHAALGHIDWSVTVVFAAASIPLSSLGARVALDMNDTSLERLYGASLLVLGVTLFVIR